MAISLLPDLLARKPLANKTADTPFGLLSCRLEIAIMRAVVILSLRQSTSMIAAQPFLYHEHFASAVRGDRRRHP